MSHFLFAAAELAPLLRQQGRRFTTGYFHLHLRGEDPAEGTEPWVLTYYHGRLLFSADQPLNAPILLRRLSRFIPRLNLDWPQRVIRVLQQRLLPDNSLAELLEMMTELGLIKPGELEDALWLNLLTDFDRYLFECAPHRSRERGALATSRCRNGLPKRLPLAGLSWSPCCKKRPAATNVLRTAHANGSTAIASATNSARSSTPSPKMASRWRPLPKSSVGKCAPHRSRDRLEVASLFAAWAKKGLVSLQTPPDLLQPQRRTPITLLAVDDSVVMQEILRQYLSQ
jgi:hypothetical protein